MTVVVVLLAAVAGGAGSTEPYATYQTSVSADAPTTQYRFDEASGATVLADSAGTRNATPSSVAFGGSGPFGGASAGAFDATNSFATLPTTPSPPLSSATAFTVEAWVNWTGGSSFNQHIFDFGSSTSKYMFLTPASSATGNPMRFEIRSKSNLFFQADAPKLATGWHHVAVTETTGGVVTLYVDGAQVGTPKTGVTINPSTLGVTTNNWLGRSQTATDPKFSGSLSNIAIYTAALSAARIEAHWNAANFPVNTALPQVSGAATDGQTLSTSNGTWSGLTPITFGYQWQRCDSAGANCADVSGATSSSYALTSPDVGSKLQVKVKGTNSAGNSTATSAATSTVQGIAPNNTALPSVSGTAADGQVLSANRGTWAGTTPITYGYQWQRCEADGSACTDIAGALTTAYGLTSAEVGKTVRIKVVASNSTPASTSTTAYSQVTGVIQATGPQNSVLPSISGTTEDGQTLTADKGNWSGTTPIAYAYQWRRCDSAGANCSDIPAAMSSSYALTAADIGSKLRVAVTASNQVGAGPPATSAASPQIASAQPRNATLPAISGTTEQGQTLTASTGTWTGTAPISYAYQWRRCDGTGANCADIAGATASSYVIAGADVGNELRVAVTASNSAGSPPPVVSAATNAVIPVGAGTCTDVWNGRAGDSAWGNAVNWSAGRVPNSSDRACIAAGATARVTGGVSATAGSVGGAGGIYSRGPIALTDASTASSIGSLNLDADASLSGASSLTIISRLDWAGRTTMSGSGTTTLGAGATGSFNAAGFGNAQVLDARTFRNLGTFSFDSGSLTGRNGAVIDNQGTLIVNTEDGTGLGVGTGTVPEIRNTGSVQKTAGSGVTHVAWQIDNESSGFVESRSGTLEFLGGGGQGRAAGGSWSATAGATTNLGAGSFYLGAGAPVVGAGTVKIRGTATAGAITGAGHLLIGPGSGTLTLTDAANVSSVASLNIGERLDWSGRTRMSGTGTTVLMQGATGSFNAAGFGIGPVNILDTRTFRNQGTFSIDAGVLGAQNGALFDNQGTLIINTQDGDGLTYNGGATPEIRNTGSVLKTSGTGNSRVWWGIDNEATGTVEARAGTLDFVGGGGQGRAGGGTWSALAGAKTNLGSGSFWLGQTTVMTGAGTIGFGGSVSAGAILGSGNLAGRGSVALTDAATTSSVASFNLQADSTLTGAGSLTITSRLDWSFRTHMTGTGATVLTSRATGSFNGSGGGYGVNTLDTRTFINEGTFTVATGNLLGLNGAVFRNDGVLHMNAPHECCGAGPGGLLYSGTGVAPQLLNNGVIIKDAGVDDTHIGFDLQGAGPVYERVGQLVLDGIWNAGKSVIHVDGSQPTIAVDPGATTVFSNGIDPLPIAATATGSTGVTTLRVVDGSGQTLTQEFASCYGGCPSPWSPDLVIPPNMLPAEDATLRVIATNPSGETAEVSVALVRDTAPPTPTDESLATVGVDDGDPTDPGAFYPEAEEQFTVPYSATDAVSGVRDLWLTSGSGETVGTSAFDCSASCPASADGAVPIDVQAISEGRHSLTLHVRDGAGNVNTSTFDAVIDHSAPAAPDSVAVSDMDTLTGDARIDWDPPQDPDLADGSTPSETNAVTYRVARGATFSSWQTSTDGGFDLTGGASGEPVTVETRAVDRAGNVSATRSTALFLVPPPNEVNPELSGGSNTIRLDSTYINAVDGSVTPRAGSLVTLRDSGGTAYPAETDQEGVAEFRQVPDGEYTLLTGYGSDEQGDTVYVSDGETRTVNAHASYDYGTDDAKAFCYAYVQYCPFFNDDADKAAAYAERLFTEEEQGSEGTKANAFKHAYWVALMVNSIAQHKTILGGEDKLHLAFAFADAHESDSRASSDFRRRRETTMDDHNNLVGYNWAVAHSPDGRGKLHNDLFYCNTLRNRIKTGHRVGWLRSGSDQFRKQPRSWELVWHRNRHKDNGKIVYLLRMDQFSNGQPCKG